MELNEKRKQIDRPPIARLLEDTWYKYDYDIVWDKMAEVVIEYYEGKLGQVRAEVLKGVGKWLMKHCKGYHRGNNGVEFGHFGIYRSEVETLESGAMPDKEKK